MILEIGGHSKVGGGGGGGNEGTRDSGKRGKHCDNAYLMLTMLTSLHNAYLTTSLHLTLPQCACVKVHKNVLDRSV